jgi:hypothetical protein
VQKYGLNLNSPDPPERCVDLSARPADLLAGKTVLRNPAKAPQKELPMSTLLLTFGREAHNARRASHGASPDKYGNFAFEVAVPHSGALIEGTRTMKIVFTSRLSHSSQAAERKATCPSRPISGLPAKRLAGGRFQQ